MTVTKEEIKETIRNGSSFPEGEVNLVDLRETVEEFMNECIDEFDEFTQDGTTIPTRLLNKYVNLMNYEALMCTFPNFVRRSDE